MAKNGNQGNGGGRKPIILDSSQIIEVEKLAPFLSIEQIADYFGFSHDTLGRIMKRQPEVMRSYKKGKSKAITSIANSLLSKARGGDVTSMIFYLKTQAGWKEKQEIEISEKKSTDDFDEFLKNVSKK